MNEKQIVIIENDQSQIIADAIKNLPDHKITFLDHNQELPFEIEYPEEAKILAEFCKERGEARDSGKRIRPIDLDTPEPTKAGIKIDRNERCPCGSGLKYKKCCINKE